MLLDFIKYVLEIKTSLKWLKYPFKIDFHVLKVLKTSLEVKILKNDQIWHEWSTIWWSRKLGGRPKISKYCFRVIQIVRKYCNG